LAPATLFAGSVRCARIAMGHRGVLKRAGHARLIATAVPPTPRRCTGARRTECRARSRRACRPRRRPAGSRLHRSSRPAWYGRSLREPGTRSQKAGRYVTSVGSPDARRWARCAAGAITTAPRKAPAKWPSTTLPSCVIPSRVLYMRGLTWQRTRGSALLGWVGEDAAFITGQISAMPGREQPQ
jgi:hypothetical protein